MFFLNECSVSDAGLIILQPAHDAEKEEVSLEDLKTVEVDVDTVKWPSKPGIPTSDLFDSEDSWFDAPPEGFNLTVGVIVYITHCLEYQQFV